MWNLSKSARRFRAADAIFVSVPKCGRTWVRTFLHAYLSERAGLELSWDVEELAARGMPRFAFTHDRWEQRATPELWRKVRGADLIPQERRRGGGIVLLVRDPRDVIVSLYFQLTRRDHWFRGELGSMLRHRRYGIGPVVDAMNGWLEEWGGRTGFELVRYEDLRAEPGPVFRRLLVFLGLDPHEGPAGAFERSLAFAGFDNMRELERAGVFEHGVLRPGNPADPESFKMRRGRVGAWVEYVAGGDVPVLEAAARRLDARLGYGGAPALSAGAGGRAGLPGAR